MADKKITELTNITGTNIADADEFVVVDASADETKAITAAELRTAIGNGDFTVTGDLTVQGTTITVDSASAQNIVLGDSDKMTFGDGSDLQIYHNGSHSYITDTGTGSLYIRGSDFVSIQAADGTNSIVADTDSEVTLYHNGSAKLATTSTGVDVIGTITASSDLHISSVNPEIRMTDSDTSNVDHYIKGSGSALVLSADENNELASSTMRFHVDGSELMRIDGDGNVGIGTTSPSQALDVVGSIVSSDNLYAGDLYLEDSEPRITLTDSDGTNQYGVILEAAGDMFYSSRDNTSFGGHYFRAYDGTSTLNRLVINAGGDSYFYSGTGNIGMGWDAGTARLGIGTTSPDNQLHVFGVGQNTAAITNSGNKDSFIRLSQNSSSAGAGGGIIFSNTQGDAANSSGMAAIKGLLADGSSNTSGHIAFSTRAATTDTALTERMRLTNAGNLGIGTTSPSQTLDVNGVATANQFYAPKNASVPGASPTTKFGRDTAQYMTFHGDASSNYLTTVSSSSNQKNRIRFGISLDSGSTVNTYYELTGSTGTIWHTGNDSTLLKTTGGTMTGDLNMGQNDITNGDTIYMDNWYRSTGNTGWFNQTYGGGVYMTDTTDVRIYASKALRIDNTSSLSIRTAGGISAYEGSGTTYIYTGKTVTVDGSLYNNTASDSYGAAILSAGRIDAARWQNDLMRLNRMGNDGALVYFYQAGSSEGSITVSGTTVSYNGGHLARWSRLADDTKDVGIVKGTVMTNLDEMVVWHHEAQPATYYEEGDELPLITDATFYEEGDEIPEGMSVGDTKTEAVYAQVGDEKKPARDAYTEDNEQLNKMAVSSVEGDPNVAGVFVNWDEEDDFNDMNIAMTGDMVIRIAQGTTVARGDLLMSAGDGTAKPQGDDIVRSKTIAKVTSTHVSHTYDDGSYLVPCVLMAC